MGFAACANFQDETTQLSSKYLKKICIEHIVNSADSKATCIRQRYA